MASIPPPLLCPTLVDRETELAALTAALDTVTRERGRVVLVTGEAGIGKSALVRRFAETARSRGARVAIGECVEIEARRPLGPFREILDSLDRQGLLRGALTRPDAELGEADESSRSRLYRSFAALFAQLGRTAPFVAIVEDLHWADEATLELVLSLARAVREERVLVVATYRSDELHRRHPLRPVLAELVRARLSNEIVLSGLDRAQIGALLGETLRSEEPSPALRDAIDESCEGNPFFVEEVLKALQQRGELVYDGERWRHGSHVVGVTIPGTVRDAVLSRLDALAAEPQRILRIAAVIGNSFDVELLRAVSGAEPEGLAQALRAAIDAQLLAPEVAGGRFSFRHALTRESVLSELLEPQQRPLHQAVGQAIEARGGGEPAQRAEDLAYHFDAARDEARAFRYRLLAAEESLRGFAFVRAARHLERAIDLAPAGASTADLYRRLEEAASLAGDEARAARAAQEAWQRFADHGDALRAGEALSRLALHRWNLIDPGAFEIAQQAVRALEPLGRTPELAMACGEVARLHWLNNRFAPAQEWASRAIELARETEAVRIEADGRITLGLALMPDDTDRGLAILREGTEIAVRRGFVALAGRGYHNVVSEGLWRMLGSAEEMWQIQAEGARHSEATGHRTDVEISDALGRSLRDGDLDAVLRLAAETSGETLWSAAARLTEAFVRVARDGPSAGLDLVEPAWQRLAGATHAHRRWGAACASEVAVMAGRPRSALAYADPIMEVLDSPVAGSVTVAVSALTAARELGDTDALARWSDLARSWASVRDSRRLAADYVAAEAAFAADRPESAVPIFRAVADRLVDLPAPVAATTVRLRCIEALLQVGERAAAAEELARAVAYWRKGKATWYLGELARWAGQHGLRLPPAEDARTKSPLTAREREVARFVSEGLSNREIAERLVISERTAEGHVQHIMDKLGFRSRAQIAAWHAVEAGALR